MFINTNIYFGSLHYWTLGFIVFFNLQILTEAMPKNSALSIDNAILGEPVLECDSGYITLKIRTKSHFMGRIFLKGMSSTGNSNDRKESNKNGRKSCEIRASEACTPLNSSQQSSTRKISSNAEIFDKSKNQRSWEWRRHLTRRKVHQQLQYQNGTITVEDSEEENTNGNDLCSMKVSFDGDAMGCPPLIRQRSLNPRGVSVVATIVVSFHPFFITRIDRMYRLQCFYRNSNYDLAMVAMVKAGFNVSGTTRIHSKSQSSESQSLAPMPTCRYEILEDGPNGHPVAFSTLSSQLYHKWSCESENVNAFCFRVHSCFAKAINGIGKMEILDTDGCAVDKFLLNNLQYSNNRLEAGQFAQVYKYADEESLYFQCQIKIWRKRSSECPKQLCKEPSAYGGLQRTANIAAESSNTFHTRLRKSSPNVVEEDMGDIDVDAEIRVIEDLEKSFKPKCQFSPVEFQRKVRQIVQNEGSAYSSLYCFTGYYLIVCLCGIWTAVLSINFIVYQALRRKHVINYEK